MTAFAIILEKTLFADHTFSQLFHIPYSHFPEAEFYASTAQIYND